MNEQFRNFGHSRAKAIAMQCFECSGFSKAERRRCKAKGCALWAFRNGYEVDENDVRVFHASKGRLSGISGAENDFDDEDDEMLVPDEADENDGINDDIKGGE